MVPVTTNQSFPGNSAMTGSGLSPLQVKSVMLRDKEVGIIVVQRVQIACIGRQHCGLRLEHRGWCYGCYGVVECLLIYA